MKKLMLFSALASAVVLFGIAATNEVKSVNVVGYAKATLPPGGQFIMKALAFDAFDSTLLGVFGTNQLRSSAGVKAPGTDGDRVYVWDPSIPGYNTYVLKSADKQFYSANQWSGSPTNPTVLAGAAFWIMSAPASVTESEITLMGEVVDVVTQQVGVVEGFQMLGYGFSSDIGIQDTAFVDSGAVKATVGAKAPNGDIIYVWDPAKGYTSYGLHSDGTWRYATNWSGAAPSDIFSMGSGFWYRRAIGGGGMVWSETNKYIGNL